MNKWLLSLFFIYQSYAVTVNDPISISSINPCHVLVHRPTLVADKKGNAALIWKNFGSMDKGDEILKIAIQENEKWSTPYSVSSAEKEIGNWKGIWDIDGSFFVTWINKKEEMWNVLKKKGNPVSLPNLLFRSKEMPCELTDIDQGKLRFFFSEEKKTHFLLFEREKNLSQVSQEKKIPIKKVDSDMVGEIAWGSTKLGKECIVFTKKHEVLSNQVMHNILHFSIRENKVAWPFFEEFSVKNSKFYDLDDFKVSLDDSGNVCLVGTARKKNGKNTRLWAWVRYENHWEKDPIFLGNTTDEVDNIQVMHDSEGNCMVSWLEVSGNISRVYVSYKPVGKPWSRSISISPEGLQLMPFLELTASGDFVLVWQQIKDWKYVSIQGKIFSSSNQTWSSSILLSPDEMCYILSGFAVGLDGKGILSWLVPKDVGALTLEVASVIFDK